MNGLHDHIALTTLCVIVAAAIAACDAAGPAVESAPSLPDAAAASGVYAMHGVTVRASEGAIREIDGTMRLHIEGESFSASFELDTTYPGPEESFPATVVGWGQGMVVGDSLAGTISSTVARTQTEGEPRPARLPVEELVVMSSSVARFTADGGLQVELQNHPGIGQDYSPSVTVLEGKRVGPLEAQP